MRRIQPETVVAVPGGVAFALLGELVQANQCGAGVVFRRELSRSKQGGFVAFDESRIQLDVLEARVVGQALQEGAIGHHTLHVQGGQRAIERCQRRVAIHAVNDELGEHRVVVHRHRIAALYAAVQAYLIRA